MIHCRAETGVCVCAGRGPPGQREKQRTLGHKESAWVPVGPDNSCFLQAEAAGWDHTLRTIAFLLQGDKGSPGLLGLLCCWLV